MKTLTVKEAVEWVNAGNNLEGVLLDESTTQQVNVRDAMVLARGGIMLPTQNIYYNDDEIEYDEDIDELVITSGVVKLSWEEKAARAQAYHPQQKEVMAKTTTIPNEKLESCIPKLIEEMKKCQNAAELCGLVENHDLPGKNKAQYPPLPFSISEEEVKVMEDDGWLIRQEGEAKSSAYSLNVKKFKEASSLEKLLLALIWKNGDLAKIHHIVLGIKGELAENGRLVFHAFGSHLANPTENPIIDQHVIRAYQLLKYFSHEENNDPSELDKIRKKTAFTAGDKALVDEYMAWVRGEGNSDSMLNIIPAAVRNDSGYLRALDDLLFAVGRYAAV